MIKYKHAVAKNGRPMYFKNGQPIAKKNIPKTVLQNLEPDTTISVSSGEGGTPQKPVDTQPNNEQESNQSKDSKCIFCRKPATRTRFVDLKTAKLCEEDYNNHTTGEVVARLRELSKEQ